jgi:hypothetical protein
VQPEEVLKLIGSASERYDSVRAALRYGGDGPTRKEIRECIMRTKAGQRAFRISPWEASERIERPIDHPEPDGPFGWRRRAWYAGEYHERLETEVPGGGVNISAVNGRMNWWEHRIGTGSREDDPRFIAAMCQENPWELPCELLPCRECMGPAWVPKRSRHRRERATAPSRRPEVPPTAPSALWGTPSRLWPQAGNLSRRARSRAAKLPTSWPLRKETPKRFVLPARGVQPESRWRRSAGRPEGARCYQLGSPAALKSGNRPGDGHRLRVCKHADQRDFTEARRDYGGGRDLGRQRDS